MRNSIFDAFPPGRASLVSATFLAWCMIALGTTGVAQVRPPARECNCCAECKCQVRNPGSGTTVLKIETSKIAPDPWLPALTFIVWLTERELRHWYWCAAE